MLETAVASAFEFVHGRSRPAGAWDCPPLVRRARNGRSRKLTSARFEAGGERWLWPPLPRRASVGTRAALLGYGVHPPSTASSPITIPMRPPQATRQVATLSVWERSVASSGLS